MNASASFAAFASIEQASPMAPAQGEPFCSDEFDGDAGLSPV
jgi:hypothetical protein